MNAFRMRLVPAWEELVPVLRERAEALGQIWPSQLPSAKYSTVYAAVLSGVGGAAPRLTVTASQPPEETPVLVDLRAWDQVHLSFEASKRAFPNAQTALLAQGLALHLDHLGLYLAATSALPQVRVVVVPLRLLVETVDQVASGALRLKSVGVDHIVDKYAAPEALQQFSLSRWRGDSSFRFSHALVRLEIWVT